jgi:hypothetical protein
MAPSPIFCIFYVANSIFNFNRNCDVLSRPKLALGFYFTIAVFGDLGAQFITFEVVAFNFKSKNAQMRGKLIVDLRALLAR